MKTILKKENWKKNRGGISFREIQAEKKTGGNNPRTHWVPVFSIASLALLSILIFASMVFLVRERGYVFKGDGLYYYAYARSILYDGDLDFSNELNSFSKSETERAVQSIGPTGRPKNKFSMGTALLIGPFYGPISSVAGPWIFGTSEPFPWLFDQAIFSFGGILVGFLGLWFSYVFVSYHFPGKDSLICTLILWACSPLLYYCIREPFMSHLPSLFCTALFLTLWKKPSLSPRLRTFLMCITGALTFITRPQDASILLVPISGFLIEGFVIKPTVRKGFGLTILYCFLGFAGIMLIQMTAWHSMYGEFLVNTYHEAGEGFIHWKNPFVFSVLFSSNHGLISWHPLIAFCLVGLIFMPKSLKNTALALLLWFAAQLYITASWHGWSMGASFGNRAFISLTPVFIFGLTSFYRCLKKPWKKRLFFSMVGLLFLWNVTLMLAFLSELIPYNGVFSWWDLIRHLPELHSSILEKISTL